MNLRLHGARRARTRLKPGELMHSRARSTVMSFAAFLAIAACNKSDQSASKAADSAGGAVANRDTTSKKAALAAVPPAVDAVGTYGEDLYDAVKAGNWKEARKLLDSLSSAAKQLPADV